MKKIIIVLIALFVSLNAYAYDSYSAHDYYVNSQAYRNHQENMQFQENLNRRNFQQNQLREMHQMNNQLNEMNNQLQQINNQMQFNQMKNMYGDPYYDE